MHFVCETHFVTPLILKHTDINNAFANRQHVYIVFNATSTTTFHGFGIFYHTIYVIAIFKQTNSHLYWITGITLCCTNQHFMKLLICRTLCTSWGWQLLSWYFIPLFTGGFSTSVSVVLVGFLHAKSHASNEGLGRKKPFPTVGAAVMSPAHATEARKWRSWLSFSVVKAVRWKGSRSIANTP